MKLTADLVILTIRSRRLHVLLITRGSEPFLDMRALPGGFVRPGETLDEAAIRELAEETGIDTRDLTLELEQVRVYSTPGRDPRGAVVTCSFLTIAPDLPAPVADTDAKTAAWVPVEDVVDDDDALAFDHAEILRDAVARARAKLQYTTIATSFCGKEFTISDLREVYETVWGTTLDRPNFHRKVTDSPGFVTPSGGRTTTSGRPAALYRAGGARLLARPIMYPSPDGEGLDFV